MAKKILDVIHETAKGLYDSGVVNATTMRKFDALCLEPIEDMSKTHIKQIRLRENVSQPVFAEYLNVSPSTVKKWENGEKHPIGASLRLLQMVEINGLEIFECIQRQG